MVENSLAPNLLHLDFKEKYLLDQLINKLLSLIQYKVNQANCNFADDSDLLHINDTLAHVSTAHIVSHTLSLVAVDFNT